MKMVVNGKDMVPKMAAAQEQMRKSMVDMSPEQRREMEAMLTQQDGDLLTRRICVSAEMAISGTGLVPQMARSECDPPKLTRDDNRTSFEMSCRHGNGRMTSKGESVVHESTIVTKFDVVTTEGSGVEQTMTAETSMKFLDEDCGAIKPIDQTRKSAAAETLPAGAPHKP